MREITTELLVTTNQDQFVIVQWRAECPDDVQQALLNIKPQVIHVFGQRFVGSEALAEYVKLYPVECVILNTCYSEELVLAISQYCYHVIAINPEIGVNTIFDDTFYNILREGKTVGQAILCGYGEIRRFGIKSDSLWFLEQGNWVCPSRYGTS